MCTVTYLPTGNNSFILTHNRDEKRSRPSAFAPKIEKLNDNQVIMPRDSKANGTWIALSEDKKVVCLLNGGFKKHTYNPPYRHSRGDIIPAYLSFENINEFLDNYYLDGIEPFTLILHEHKKLYEMRWDGNNNHLKELDIDTPHIYSSVTLYTEDAIEDRKRWFKHWLKEHLLFNVPDIRDFHCHGGDGDKENALVMKRADIYSTVSITSIEKNIDGAEMIYKDLLDGTTTINSITF